MQKRWPIALALVSMTAIAQPKVSGESPRDMAFEFKMGALTPLIDRPFADLPQSQRPYQSVFGAPMLLAEVEIERQFFQRVGSLALGLSAGYAEKYGQALEANTGAASSEGTSLHMLPLKLLAVYRFDWLAINQGIPLVPYLKGGGVLTHWWSQKGGATEVSDGQPALGWAWGFAGVGGLAVQLDFIDYRLARDFDTGVGVNHTYLFAEFAFQEVKGKGSRRPLDFSSRHWMFGLAFEY
ncbi:MAG: hypothetical protein K1X64_10030 [Myxococcaceae bacterium]|nr:hypothetical protein [Myxococcaceae bacterium]